MHNCTRVWLDRTEKLEEHRGMQRHNFLNVIKKKHDRSQSNSVPIAMYLDKICHNCKHVYIIVYLKVRNHQKVITA